MDSVDSRQNGTIGGFCKATVVEEEQCDVENAFCNEKSITCQCKPGYELKMNFEDQNDTVNFTFFMAYWPKIVTTVLKVSGNSIAGRSAFKSRQFYMSLAA